MIHRVEGVINAQTDGDLEFSLNHSVIATSIGAVVSGGSGVTWNVYAPHSFRVGDKALKVVAGGTSVFTNAITAVTTTSVTWAESQSFSVGDKLVNLGPDGGTATPNYDASKVVISSVPDGAVTIANSKVSVSNTGVYEYWYKGSGGCWELVLNGSDEPVSVIAGWGGTDNVSVIDFGCAMDGVTDDSEAFQALIDSASLSGGELTVITIPSGVMLLETGVNVLKGTTIVGAGVDRTFLTAGAGLTSGGVVLGRLDGARAFFVSIADLTIDADNIAEYALEANFYEFCSLRRIKFINGTVAAMLLNGSASVTATLNRVEQCQFRNSPIGTALTGAATNGTTFDSCIYRVCTTAGAEMTGGAHNAVRWTDCSFETCGIGVHLNPSASSIYNVIKDCRFETCTTENVKLVGSFCKLTNVMNMLHISVPSVATVTDTGDRTYIYPPLSKTGKTSGFYLRVYEEEIDLAGGSTASSADVMSAVGIIIGGSYRVTETITGTATGFDVGLTGELTLLASNDTTLTAHVVTQGLVPVVETAAVNGVVTAVGGTFTGGKVRVSISVLEIARVTT